MSNLVGKEVTWEKLEGKINIWTGINGSGILQNPILVGNYLFISGDYGISTSEITGVNYVHPDGVMVQTLNSLYLIKELK